MFNQNEWGYIWASYAITAIVVVGYSIYLAGLNRRARALRDDAARSAAGRAPRAGRNEA